MVPPGGYYQGRSVELDPRTINLETMERDLLRYKIELVETHRSSAPPTYQRVVTSDTLERYITAISNRPNWARFVHILFVDTFGTESVTYNRTLRDKRPGQRLVSVNANDYAFDHSWFEEAQITQAGQTVKIERHVRTQGAIAFNRQNPQIDLFLSNGRWIVRLNDDLQNLTSLGLTNAPFNMDLRFKYWQQGRGDTFPLLQTVVISMRWMVLNAAGLFLDEGLTLMDYLLNVVMHELGHVMGLAPERLPIYDDEHRQFRRNSQADFSQGWHCGGTSPSGQHCIMYEYAEGADEFCCNCSTALSAMKLERLPVRIRDPRGTYNVLVKEKNDSVKYRVKSI